LPLSVRFKIDQNLPVEVAGAFRAAGHDAETVYQESLSGAPDPKLADAARAEARAIVTLDVGFADIRTYPPSEHAGLVVLRPARQDKATVFSLVTRVILLLEQEPLTGRLWIVDERRVRIRGD
jgi:predicted nuclease of predicted toxin-antitoxin system